MAFGMLRWIQGGVKGLSRLFFVLVGMVPLGQIEKGAVMPAGKRLASTMDGRLKLSTLS